MLVVLILQCRWLVVIECRSVNLTFLLPLQTESVLSRGDGIGQGYHSDRHDVPYQLRRSSPDGRLRETGRRY